MTVYGFHASHEQIDPAQLLGDVRAAESAGFAAAMCSDHFAPWSARQGQSGFAWSWLGAALARTGLSFGVVTAPGQRYHPAVIAQAIGTLAVMFPDRVWAALGSGENVNEHITGTLWPRKQVRQRRLEECATVMRALLDGEEVSHDGLVTVDRARLWTRPTTAPPLFGAAVSVATARACAAWADGLITVDQPLDHLRAMIDTYREAGGTGPICVQVHLSIAHDESHALAIARDQWGSNAFGPPTAWELATPEEFDQITAAVTDEQVRHAVFVSAEPARHAEHLRGIADLGVDRIYLHHVGQRQLEFIETFGRNVLPELHSDRAVA